MIDVASTQSINDYSLTREKQASAIRDSMWRILDLCIETDFITDCDRKRWSQLQEDLVSAIKLRCEHWSNQQLEKVDPELQNVCAQSFARRFLLLNARIHFDKHHHICSVLLWINERIRNYIDHPPVENIDKFYSVVLIELKIQLYARVAHNIVTGNYDFCSGFFSYDDFEEDENENTMRANEW